MLSFKEANFINGVWVSSQNTFEVINPATGEVLGSVPQFGSLEAKNAILAAHSAFLKWKELPARERAQFMRRWAELIEENKIKLAEIITQEQGKSLTESLAEIDYANSFIKWFAEEAMRIYGDIIPPVRSGQQIHVIKQPVGVTAAITPWNFPAAMITRKCAPALAAGCTMVIKPAEETPFTALALAALAEKAGFPAGTINIITGIPEEIGLELTTHPLVRKFSFTGSTAVGKLLMKQCASTVKKISLELGGNAPFIVFEDADLDAAVHGAVARAF